MVLHRRGAELVLLDDGERYNTTSSSSETAHHHELRTAPLVTYDAFVHEDSAGNFPQTGVLGRVIEQQGASCPQKCVDPRIYLNMNAPLSGVVCGVQGSGKSHSVSVLLENFMLRDERIGELETPLSSVVFHFDSAAAGASVSPCEAACLSALRSDGRSAVPVTVLVSPSYVGSMRKVYNKLPDVTVEQLHLAAEDVTAERLQALMLCDTTERRPLYMETALGMMRDMGESFDFSTFRKMLDDQDWLPAQRVALSQRLKLLDTYLKGGTRYNSVKTYFKPGHLVIIDLTDPMVDAITSTGMFDIVLGLFMDMPVTSGGKVVVLDEAHKYLRGDHGSSRLTLSIESLIRQQRHLATRTIISTQEPTIIPETILDLVSFLIVHRFTSPSWASHLDKHISFGRAFKGHADESWFDIALGLRTGEALVFAPSAACRKLERRPSPDLFVSDPFDMPDQRSESWLGPVGPLGRGYFLIKTRQRLTVDGGMSQMAVGINAVDRPGQEKYSSATAVAGTSSWSLPAAVAPTQTTGGWHQRVSELQSTSRDSSSPSTASPPTDIVDLTLARFSSAASMECLPAPSRDPGPFLPLLQTLAESEARKHPIAQWSYIRSFCSSSLATLCGIPAGPRWVGDVIKAAASAGLVEYDGAEGGRVWMTTAGRAAVTKRPGTLVAPTASPKRRPSSAFLPPSAPTAGRPRNSDIICHLPLLKAIADNRRDGENAHWSNVGGIKDLPAALGISKEPGWLRKAIEAATEAGLTAHSPVGLPGTAVVRLTGRGEAAVRAAAAAGM